MLLTTNIYEAAYAVCQGHQFEIVEVSRDMIQFRFDTVDNGEQMAMEFNSNMQVGALDYAGAIKTVKKAMSINHRR